jgi:hypothetical protein
VYLFNTNSQIADSVAFGFQPVDLSIGRSGGTWTLLSQPTPGAANASSAPLGDPVNLRLNEWMANPVATNDWFELYNGGALPLNLAGLYLTDDPSISGATKFQVPLLSFISGRGWVKYEADSHRSHGPNHVNFSLDLLGKTLRLYNSNLALIDEVDYGIQSGGVSQGRFPDGAANVYSMPTPTPGAANVIPNNPPVLNAISNRFVYLGQALQLTATATDPESWYQTLTFSLTNSPAGAAINPLTGAFSWAATNVAAPGTNSVTVRVTYNGVPPLSDTKTFWAMIQPPAQFSSVNLDGNGNINFTFSSLPGQSYQLQSKGDLNDPQWTSLGLPAAGSGDTLTLSDNMTAEPRRFYRLVITPQ